MSLPVLHLLIALYASWECWRGAKQLRHSLLKTLIFGAIALIHGIVPILAPPWNLRTPEPFEVHVDAARYALVGTLLLGCGWRLYDRWFPVKHSLTAFEYVREPSVSRRLELVFILCAVGGVIAWIGGIFASGATLQSLLNSRRLEFRGSGNGVLAGLFVQSFCMAYVPGFLGPQLRSRYRTAGIIYVIAFAFVLFVFTKGTRAGALGLIGSLTAGMIFASRISLGKLVFAGTAMTLIALLAIAAVPLRHRMATMSPSEMVGFLLSHEAYQDALAQDPLNYHDNLVAVMDIFPDVQDYQDLASYRRIVFFFLPGDRFSFLKPRDPNRVVAEALFGEAAIHVDWMHPPGIFGDVYVNAYGWKGISFFLFEGFLLAFIARQLTYRPWFFIGLAPQTIYLTLVGIRGQPYTVATVVIATLTVTGVICCLCGVPLRMRAASRTKKKVRATSRIRLQQAAA